MHSLATPTSFFQHLPPPNRDSIPHDTQPTWKHSTAYSIACVSSLFLWCECKRPYWYSTVCVTSNTTTKSYQNVMRYIIRCSSKLNGPDPIPNSRGILMWTICSTVLYGDSHPCCALHISFNVRHICIVMYCRCESWHTSTESNVYPHTITLLHSDIQYFILYFMVLVMVYLHVCTLHGHQS